MKSYIIMLTLTMCLGFTLILTLSTSAFAKDTYFLCTDRDWKYSDSWFSAGEVFYDQGGEWIKSKAKIFDDKLVISGWSYSDTCKPKCDLKYVISLLIQGKDGEQYTEIREISDTENCSTMWAGSCMRFAKGDEIRSRNCKVVEK